MQPFHVIGEGKIPFGGEGADGALDGFLGGVDLPMTLEKDL